MDKLFVVKKYIKAPSLKAALRIEKKIPVSDAWIDDDWRKANMEEEKPKKNIGFTKNGKTD